MANEIRRKELFKQLGNIKRPEEWIKACDLLKLRICRGTKHTCTVRNPEKPDDDGRASLITTIPNSLHRIMNQAIFKELMKFGVPEDDIWTALGFL